MITTLKFYTAACMEKTVKFLKMERGLSTKQLEEIYPGYHVSVVNDTYQFLSANNGIYVNVPYDTYLCQSFDGTLTYLELGTLRRNWKILHSSVPVEILSLGGEQYMPVDWDTPHKDIMSFTGGQRVKYVDEDAIAIELDENCGLGLDYGDVIHKNAEGKLSVMAGDHFEQLCKNWGEYSGGNA